MIGAWVRSILAIALATAASTAAAEQSGKMASVGVLMLARMAEAVDQPGGHGIVVVEGHHDRNRVGRLPRRARWGDDAHNASSCASCGSNSMLPSALRGSILMSRPST